MGCLRFFLASAVFFFSGTSPTAFAHSRTSRSLPVSRFLDGHWHTSESAGFCSTHPMIRCGSPGLEITEIDFYILRIFVYTGQFTTEGMNKTTWISTIGILEKRGKSSYDTGYINLQSNESTKQSLGHSEV